MRGHCINLGFICAKAKAVTVSLLIMSLKARKKDNECVILRAELISLIPTYEVDQPEKLSEGLAYRSPIMIQ